MSMEQSEIITRLSSFPGEWDELLKEEKEKEYFKKLVELVSEEYMKNIVHPSLDNVYHALSLVNPHEVRVIIIGQDPYFNPDQANGLAFSVNDGVRFPPSLLNIYKELNIEYGYPIPKHGSLDKWAEQGVLLLNASLTLRDGAANSHSKFGWMNFTDSIIRKIDSLNNNVVYLLWVNFAKKKMELIHSKNAYVIYCAHPSPLSASRGFFHSGCFKKCNEHLKEIGEKEINFRID